MRFRNLLLAALLAASVSAVAAFAAGGPLAGTVGPGYTIKLSGADGFPVKQLDPGTYELTVDDRSEEHNFHLTGPGVSETTEVEGTGSRTFSVTLGNGRYTFVCDPHSSTMRGTFDVGTGPPPPPPPPPPAAGAKLSATVGPGATIVLRNVEA